MGFGLNLELYPSISDPEGLQILEPLPPEKQQLFLLLFYLFPYSWLLKISALRWKAATLGHKIHCPLFSLVFNVLLLSSRFFFFFLFPLSFQVAERSLKKKKKGFVLSFEQKKTLLRAGFINPPSILGMDGRAATCLGKQLAPRGRQRGAVLLKSFSSSVDLWPCPLGALSFSMVGFCCWVAALDVGQHLG